MNNESPNPFLPGTTEVAGGEMNGQPVVVFSCWAAAGVGRPPPGPPNVVLAFIPPVAQAIGMHLIGESAVIARELQKASGQNTGTAEGRLNETRGILEQMREAMDDNKHELTGLLIRRALEVSEPRTS